MSALGHLKSFVESLLEPLHKHEQEQDEKLADLDRRVAALESPADPVVVSSARTAKKAAPRAARAQAGAAEVSGDTPSGA
jgi:hypothetical protein